MKEQENVQFEAGVSGIMHSIELVEGKDHPSQLLPKEFDNKSTTVGLLLQMTECQHSGHVVIMDTGVCVLKALIELVTDRAYSSAIMKNWQFWPKYVDGDGIRHFLDQAVGDVASLP